MKPYYEIIGDFLSSLPREDLATTSPFQLLQKFWQWFIQHYKVGDK